MKIQEVLKLAEPDWPGDARSVAADRTRTTLAPVQAPNRIARGHRTSFLTQTLTLA